MSLQNSDHSQPYEACLATALAEASSIARRLVLRGSRSMMQAALHAQDTTRRASLVDARQLLVQRQDQFGRELPDCLKAAIEIPCEADQQVPRALKFDALELMPEEQLDDTVEMVRALQLVSAAVEFDLVQFNALLSAARGLQVVRASGNPLRPETWVNAVREATLRCKPPLALRLHWIHHLGEALGPEVADVYRMLCGKLKQEGVGIASFQLTQPPPRLVPSHANKEPARITLRDLRRLLIGEAAADAVVTHNPMAHDAGLTVPFAFEALKELERPEQVLRRMQEKHASGAWSRGAASRSGSEERAVLTPVQVLSQEVATLMVDNISADARLPAAAQKAVRQLLPALLQLVANDTRFFNDKQHPARQMLEEVTRRSQAWSTPSQPGSAAFFDSLEEVVQSLSAMPAVDAENFDYALHTLRDAWSEAQALERRRTADSARALLAAETRNLTAGAIGAELLKRPDLPMAPVEVRRFIMGPWCQVMAAARLADKSSKHADPGGYGAIINDLIWTSQPRLTAGNPARLAQLAPPLLKRLHEGLDKIEYSREASHSFFDFLHRVHGLGIQEVGQAERLGSEDVSPVQADEFGMIPWFSPTEIGESRLMQDRPEPSGLPATHAQDANGSAPEAGPSVTVAELRPDRLVEVFVKGKWVRWRLSWVSPQNTLLMFVNHRGNSESMTRQMLERMFGLGALRLLPQQSVVEGALDAVARAALDRSIDAAD